MKSSSSAHPTTSIYEHRELAEDIRRITASIRGDGRTRHISASFLPDRNVVLEILDELRAIVFPGFFGERDISDESLDEHITHEVESVARRLAEQISCALRYEKHLEEAKPNFAEECAECDASAAQIVHSFLSKIPEVRRLLSLDVQAAFDGDPAAQHTDEVIFCYPGLRALFTHRLSHELYKLKVPLIPRIMSEAAHSATGIDIHPGARIGGSFFIDHGTGVVIGETTIIGDHCKLYQGVTLGAKSFEKDESGRLRRGVKRHPTLEDHVTVYAGAAILGGDTIIGAGCVINGGVFLTQSVPPGHIVRGPKADTRLRSNPEIPPGNYFI